MKKLLKYDYSGGSKRRKMSTLASNVLMVIEIYLLKFFQWQNTAELVIIGTVDNPSYMLSWRLLLYYFVSVSSKELYIFSIFDQNVSFSTWKVTKRQRIETFKHRNRRGVSKNWIENVGGYTSYSMLKSPADTGQKQWFEDNLQNRGS